MTRTIIAVAIMAFGCVAATGACAKGPDVVKREYVRSGDRFAAQRKYREAVIQYRNAVQQDPAFGEAHVKLAETYERLGDVASALGAYMRAADLLPGNADVQVEAAKVLLLAQQFDAAKARAERALAAAPHNVEAQIAKGNALAGLENVDAAVAEIEGAIRESPDRGASTSISPRSRRW